MVSLPTKGPAYAGRGRVHHHQRSIELSIRYQRSSSHNQRTAHHSRPSRSGSRSTAIDRAVLSSKGKHARLNARVRRFECVLGSWVCASVFVSTCTGAGSLVARLRDIQRAARVHAFVARWAGADRPESAPASPSRGPSPECKPAECAVNGH